MPAGGAQCQFIGRRDMPADVGDIHREECGDRVSEHAEHAMQGRGTEEGAEAVAQGRLREAAQQWNHRRAQKQEGRHNRHQYQVLCHMGDQ